MSALIKSPKFRISAISLDLDDTLWPCAPVIEAADERQFEALIDCCPAIAETSSLEALRRERMRYMHDRPALHHDLTRLRRDFLLDLLQKHSGPIDAVDALMADFLDHRSRVSFYPGALAALEALAADYRLIACTNGNAEISRTEAGPLFSASISSGAVGVAKPAAPIFAAVCEAAGVGAAEILHVGDNPQTDALGALQAGMHSVWLNRDGVDWPHAQRPHGEIGDFAHLPDWLRAQREGAAAD